MKTVIIDNSLCTLPIDERAKPQHIGRYIQALAETGVKYVEIDFRTVMKMNELPDGIGYIFRLANPMFSEIAQVFDFDYVLVTIPDLKDYIKIGKTPAILELPLINGLSQRLIGLAQGQISAPITMARIRGSYPFMSLEEVDRMLWQQRTAVTVPLDICPMNEKKAALDTAIKASMFGIDSITVCMGRSRNYASLEDYIFSLMSVHDILPKEFSLSALCRAELLRHVVFGSRTVDCVTEMMRIIDRDINSLTNADTGERVKMHISLKDKMLLQHNYVTALERFAEEEEIPEDLMEEMTDAINHFDFRQFNHDVVGEDWDKLLN